MKREEVTACESGTPVMLADAKLGVLVFDGRVTDMDEERAAVRILTGHSTREHRSVLVSELVDLRREKGALVELR